MTKPVRQIILAEDNPGDVVLVRRALQEHGVHCDLKVITNGEAVMTFISELDLDSKSPCPDLLLLDLNLPRVNGETVMRHLRSSERCAQTPIVVLSSSDSPYDRANADLHAAVHYFHKTASLTQFMTLGQIVSRVIGMPAV